MRLTWSGWKADGLRKGQTHPPIAVALQESDWFRLDVNRWADGLINSSTFQEYRVQRSSSNNRKWTDSTDDQYDLRQIKQIEISDEMKGNELEKGGHKLWWNYSDQLHQVLSSATAGRFITEFWWEKACWRFQITRHAYEERYIDDVTEPVCLSIYQSNRVDLLQVGQPVRASQTYKRDGTSENQQHQ